MPDNSPTSPQLERFVWEVLRLISKLKRSIIETLLRVGEPLAPAKLRELGRLESCPLELVRYHAKYLERRGVHFLPRPPASSPSPPSPAAA